MEKLICMESSLKDMEEIILNKKEFINEIAKRCNISTYVIEEHFNVMAEIIAEKLIVGENVEIPKLGKFHMVKRKELIGKNLFGECEKQLEACTYPSFKIFKPLKTRIKNGHRYQKIL